MWKYGQLSFSRYTQILMAFGVLLGVSLSGALPEVYYRSIYSLQILMFLSSRITQILENYRNKSTGTLSPITLALGWIGNLVRLTTLIIDLGFSDMQIICFNITYFTFNFTPFLQYFMYYGNEIPKKDSGKAKEKMEKKEEVVSVKKSKKKEEPETEGNSSDEVVMKRKKAKRRET